MSSYAMIVNNKFRRLCEDYSPEALTTLKEYGIENGNRIVVMWGGTPYKGKLLVAGEDPKNTPVIWFNGRGNLIPIPEVDVIVRRD